MSEPSSIENGVPSASDTGTDATGSNKNDSNKPEGTKVEAEFKIPYKFNPKPFPVRIVVYCMVCVYKVDCRRDKLVVFYEICILFFFE